MLFGCLKKNHVKSRQSNFMNIKKYSKTIFSFLNFKSDKLNFLLSIIIFYGIIINCNTNKDIKYYDERILEEPNNPELYFKRGQLYKDSAFNKAIRDFDKAIDLNYKNLSHVYESRGECYDSLHNIEKAMDDYSTAILYDANNVDSYMGRGYLKFKMKDFDKSIEDFNIAYNLDNEYGSAKLYIGNCYFLKGLNCLQNNDVLTAIEYFNTSELTFIDYSKGFEKLKNSDEGYKRLLSKIDIKKAYYYELIKYKGIALSLVDDKENAKKCWQYLKDENENYSNICDSLINSLK